MNFLARQIAKQASKRAKDIIGIDPGSPLTIDNTEFLLQIGKGTVKILKEVIF